MIDSIMSDTMETVKNTRDNNLYSLIQGLYIVTETQLHRVQTCFQCAPLFQIVKTVY